MNDNKILFVDLDGTLIKEDLSYLAFSHSLKNYPLKTLFYILVFLFKGKSLVFLTPLDLFFGLHLLQLVSFIFRLLDLFHIQIVNELPRFRKLAC